MEFTIYKVARFVLFFMIALVSNTFGLEFGQEIFIIILSLILSVVTYMEGFQDGRK